MGEMGVGVCGAVLDGPFFLSRLFTLLKLRLPL